MIRLKEYFLTKLLIIIICVGFQLESLHKHDKNNLSTKISVIQDMLESLEKKLLDYKKVLEFLENSSHT